MRSTMRSRAGAERDAADVSRDATAYPSIAARANGGTSYADVTSRTLTRPVASPSGRRSVREIGATASFKMRRASSSGIVEVNGRITVTARCSVRLQADVTVTPREQDGRALESTTSP